MLAASLYKIDDAVELIQYMSEAIAHRGPDDSGVWHESDSRVVLAHRRLSILDLSQAGHQPMVSPSGRYVIAFNGEIYNHIDLRKNLENVEWIGHSDTETLLALIDAKGIEIALRSVVGMFAFALWDTRDKILTLARDRMGEKPLYYGWIGKSLVFASELKALRRHPEFDNCINRDALALYMRYAYVPTPWSIHERVWKLPAGSIVQFHAGDDPGKGMGDIRKYWSLHDVATRGLNNPFSGDERDAESELEVLLSKSIQGQMISDVPLGAFLSGGVDSSTVVSLMQKLSDDPVKTFSIGFYEQEYNEANHARAVASFLGTDHTELYVTADDAMGMIPHIPHVYDEPFADASQIPTMLIAKLARQHVTVALSGDGGDELFGGYNRYFLGASWWRRFNSMPDLARRVIAGLIRKRSPRQWESLFAAVSPLLPKSVRVRLAGDKMHKLASLMEIVDDWELYSYLVSYWCNPDPVVKGASGDLEQMSDSDVWLAGAEFEHRMMYMDSITYLPDDILVKVDRAAMNVSLETRIPLLDHRIVEFAWSLPLDMKIRNGHGKHLLRNVLYKHVPKDLVERPKMGFGVPLDSWLRGPLRGWAEDLLSEEQLNRQGYLYSKPIRIRWREHLEGRRNWAYHLWGVLMFQSWLESQRA